MALESESLEFTKFHCDVCNPYGITLIVEDKSEKVNELCPTSKTRSSTYQLDLGKIFNSSVKSTKCLGFY